MVIDESIWGNPQDWNYLDQNRYHDIRQPSFIDGENNYKTLYRAANSYIIRPEQSLDHSLCYSGMGEECPYSNISYYFVENGSVQKHGHKRDLTNWVFYEADNFSAWVGRTRTTCFFANGYGSEYREFDKIIDNTDNANRNISPVVDFNYKKAVMLIRVVCADSPTGSRRTCTLQDYLTTDYQSYPYVYQVYGRLYYEYAATPILQRMYINEQVQEGNHYFTTAILDDYRTQYAEPVINRTYANHIAAQRGCFIPILGLSYDNNYAYIPYSSDGLVAIIYGDIDWTVEKDNNDRMYISYHVVDINTFKEIALKAAASFGVYFTPDTATAQSGALTDEKMYIGVLDANGVAHGEYLQGNGTSNAIQNTWGTARNNTYDPNPSPVQELDIPMEYYNVYSKEYISTLKKENVRYLFKLELLSDDEHVIGEIVKDLESVNGQINVNYEQITRRSCFFSVINVDKKYLPSKNSAFWFNRKFMLWIGVFVHDDIYWWSQGVYYAKSATSEGRNLSIEGVDKGGALDGALRMSMTSSQYVVNAKSKLVDVIKDLLAMRIGSNDIVTRGYLRMGGDRPIDVIPPRINTAYNNQIVQSELTIDNNTYISELLLQLADLWAAEAYYDASGHFRFEPYILNAGYVYAPTQWTFTDLSSTFESANYTTSFDAENAVCVYTNSSEAARNVAYTAYNTNPLSPVNIGIGIRRAQDIEIEYYNMENNAAEINSAKEDITEIKEEIELKHIDLTKTVYGNIDTNARQVLMWTEQNLERFADELESWGYEPEELLNSISTVMGASSEFDGVEIAYSPLLQTEDGAVLLDADLVDEYIWGLIDEAGEGWTTEELLALDLIGLEFDELLIKGLIADAGETAIATGEAMHYVGQYGVLALAENNLYELEHKNEEQQIKDCRSAANYYLKKNSMLGIQLSFSCPLIPHLDVNKTIDITDQWHDIANGIFVIQSLTIPLGSNAMEISATNINWLPNDMGYDGVTEFLTKGG